MNSLQWILRAVFALALLATPVEAQQYSITGAATGITSVTCASTTITPPSGTCYTAGQLVGEPSTGSASAGNIGEFISQSVTGVSVTSGTIKDITSVSLTAGDWDCNGTMVFNYGAGTPTASEAWISTTSVTRPTSPGNGAWFQYINGSTISTQDAIPTGTGRFSLSGTTTVFLTGFATIASTTITADAFLRCRRAR